MRKAPWISSVRLLYAWMVPGEGIRPNVCLFTSSGWRRPDPCCYESHKKPKQPRSRTPKVVAFPRCGPRLLSLLSGFDSEPACVHASGTTRIRQSPNVYRDPTRRDVGLWVRFVLKPTRYARFLIWYAATEKVAARSSNTWAAQTQKESCD